MSKRIAAIGLFITSAFVGLNTVETAFGFDAPISITYLPTQTGTDSQAAAKISVRLRADELVLKPRKIGGMNFTEILWQGESHSAKIGAPDLPRINRLLAIPATTDFQVKVRRSDPVRISNVVLMPRQPDVIDDGRSAPFAFDPKAYRRINGMPIVKTGFATPNNESLTSGFRLELLSISPFLYDPKAKLLTVFETIEIEIQFSKDYLPGLRALTAFQKTPGPHAQLHRLATVALNGQDLLAMRALNRSAEARGDETPPKPKAIIITSETLATEARRLETIHADYEFELKTVTPSTTAEVIREHIKSVYRRSDLAAVIIVGDESHVRYAVWNGLPSDSWYSYVDGTDGIADVALGRLPAATTAEARLMLDRTERYIELQNQGMSTKKVMLAAHAEEYPGKYTANMEAVRKSPNPRNLVFDLQYGGKSATNDSVLQALPTGFAIVNYRGHGSATTWAGWDRNGRSFGQSQVSAMRNVDQSLTMVFNIACDTGAFHQTSRSMAEAMLLLAPKRSVHRGAVNVIAATKPSYTEVNHRFAVNLFGFIQNQPSVSVGEIYRLANNKLVTDANGSINDNTRMYVLFGDPLLRPAITQ